MISLKTDADYCLLHQDYEEAIKKYELVVNKEPKFAEAWNNMASAYGFLGNHTSALFAYLKAADIDSMYGKALWGASMALINLGREAEAMGVLNNLLKYYDFKDANSIIADFKKKGISPISVCRDLESQCLIQITLIASLYDLDCPTIPDINLKVKNMFEEIFSPFFGYLVGYYEKVDKIKLSNVTSEFMLLAGMASAKFFFNERTKVLTEGIVKLLSTEKGFYAMDEYCCDYLGIQYEPDNGNILSPCIAQMNKAANRLYSDIINQVKSIAHIKVMVHDIASSFFVFGYYYVEYRTINNLPLVFQPKSLSKRDILTKKLKAMANVPEKKKEERSVGAMCYSISIPEDEDYKCDHCGCTFHDSPEDGEIRYFDNIRKMGYDCKLERWCKDCCLNQKLEIRSYSKSEYVLFIRLDPSEQYRISVVTYHSLFLLYNFLKEDNTGRFGDIEFNGESIKKIEKLLGIKIDS